MSIAIARAVLVAWTWADPDDGHAYSHMSPKDSRIFLFLCSDLAAAPGPVAEESAAESAAASP